MRRIVLYSKPDCSLCEEARAFLDTLGHPYDVVEDPRYEQRVPVVVIDGEVVSELSVHERAIRKAIKRQGEG